MKKFITGRKKTLVAGTCLTLALTLGATTAFAASAAEGPMLLRSENGNHSYSTDEGQTWTAGAPEGAVFTVNEDGSSTVTTVTMSAIPELIAGQGLMCRNEDGVVSYSTDGGETWSDTLPEGFEAVTDPSGAAGIRTTGTAMLPGAGGGSIMVRNEDGAMSYSTDGGETWIDGAPEGTVITEDAEGRSFVSIGAPPMPGDGGSFMARNENGTMSYSADGGETWTSGVPYNVTQEADGSIRVTGLE